jgi:hypothetical protein
MAWHGMAWHGCASLCPQVARRMEQLLRRATLEYFFSVAQVRQILEQVPHSGRPHALLVLFNCITGE